MKSSKQRGRTVVAEPPKEAVTARRPRILIVGGEAKNFQGLSFGEKFDHHIHIKADGNSVKGVKGTYDAVVGLPWITPALSRSGKAFASDNGIPYIETPKVGQIEYWLAKRFKWAEAYFKDFDKPVSVQPAKFEPETNVPTIVPTPESAVLWDEDQLWSAYGEKFVQNLKGLDGEMLSRQDFIELMESEMGLRGEPVEILVSILRRQGVIVEEDGTVTIGSLEKVDAKKRREFIDRQTKGRPSFSNGAQSIQNEVREALASEDVIEEPESDEHGAKLMQHFSLLPAGKVYERLKDLSDELARTGMLRAGKPVSLNGMRLILERMAKTGDVVRDKTGIGFAFRILLPKLRPSEMAPLQVQRAKEEPPVPPTFTPPPPPAAPKGIMTSRPFEAIFAQEAPVQAAPELPFPTPVEEKDIAKEGVLYKLLEKACPNGQLPELGALVVAVRAFHGLFYEVAWDTAAAKGILGRLRLPITDANQKRTISRRFDFTDDEWSYFALEYLRDQTLFSLLPLINDTNRVWRVCGNCQKHYHFNVPTICFDCREDSRRFVSDVKGGS